MEFQGPLVRSVDYSAGGDTVNITDTAVTSIDLRSVHGFEVKTLFLTAQMSLSLLCKCVVREIDALTIVYGCHRLFPVGMP